MTDTATTAEDTAITLPAASLLGNDSDVDGDTLTITSVQGATNGTVALNPDGTVTFIPASNYNGPASFTYTISDGNGGTATATANINVTPVNDVPTGAPQPFDPGATTPEDINLVVPVATLLAKFTDADGDSLTITSVQNPTNGTVVLNNDGTITFTPTPDYFGPAGFSYTVSDGQGGTVDGFQLIDVTPVNDPPTALNDADTTPEDVAITFAAATLLANDSDIEGDTLTITSVQNPTNGTVALNPDGTVTFIPASNYNGPASFTYTISDGNGGDATATVDITVTPVNDAPVAVDDTAEGTESAPIVIPIAGLLANDSDPEGGPVTFVGFTQPTLGSVTLVGNTLVYNPNNAFDGLAEGQCAKISFTYTISDGDLTSDADVTLCIAGEGVLSIGGGLGAGNPVNWVTDTDGDPVLYYRRWQDTSYTTFDDSDVAALQTSVAARTKVAELDPLQALNAQGLLATETTAPYIYGTVSNSPLSIGMGVDTANSVYNNGNVATNPEINASAVNGPTDSDILGVELGSEAIWAKVSLTLFFSTESGTGSEAARITLRNGGRFGEIVGEVVITGRESDAGFGLGVVSESGHTDAVVDVIAVPGSAQSGGTATGAWGGANPGLTDVLITANGYAFDTIELSSAGYVRFVDTNGDTRPDSWAAQAVPGGDVADYFLRQIDWKPVPDCDCVI